MQSTFINLSTRYPMLNLDLVRAVRMMPVPAGGNIATVLVANDSFDITQAEYDTLKAAINAQQTTLLPLGTLFKIN